MKKQLFIPALLLCLALNACHKQVENKGIVGGWKLQQVFNGYLMGGDFQWHDIVPGQSEILRFSGIGTYTKESLTAPLPTCTGQYQLNNDMLQTITNCEGITVTRKVSYLNSKMLILDVAVLEGTIRYKYSAVE